MDESWLRGQYSSTNLIAAVKKKRGYNNAHAWRCSVDQSVCNSGVVIVRFYCTIKHCYSGSCHLIGQLGVNNARQLQVDLLFR